MNDIKNLDNKKVDIKNDTIIDEFKEKFYLDIYNEDSKTAEWNLFRNEIVKRLFNIFLYDEQVKDASKWLDKKAEKHILKDCENNFSKRCEEGPYKLITKKYEDNTKPNILSFVGN